MIAVIFKHLINRLVWTMHFSGVASTHPAHQVGGAVKLAAIAIIAKHWTEWRGLHSCSIKPWATNQITAVTPPKVVEPATS